LRGMGMKDEDYVVDMFTCSSHDYIMFFTSHGRVFWVKGYNVPSGSRTAKGKPLVHLLPNLEEGETICSNIHISEFSEDRYLLFATKKGRIKRTSLTAYSRPRSTGIKAILLNDDDELVGTSLCYEDNEAVLATALGIANRFKIADARSMGRTAYGVKGMRLKYDDDEVISLAILPPSEDVESDDVNGDDEEPNGENGEIEEEYEPEGPKLLTITEKGYGKRALAWNYRLTRRGSGGVINIRREQMSETGKVVRVMLEKPDSDILMISQSGMVIRTITSCIRLLNRVGKGVIVMRLKDDDIVTAVSMVQNLEDDSEENGEECEIPEDGAPAGSENENVDESVTS